jgi:Sulfotransferase family
MPATYNPNKPLISIHIPKTGGSTIHESLRLWFGVNFYTHYVNEETASPPYKIEILGNSCIHGHFNRFRRYGVDDFYPNSNQFITFLRDPFEQHISTFFYLKREAENYKFNGYISEVTSMKSFDEFLQFLTKKRGVIQNTFANTILAHLPTRFSPFDAHKLFRQEFIHMGLTEKLEFSMKLLAKKLGKEYVEIPPQNISKRFLPINETHRNMHKELFPEEHFIYNEIKDLHLNELAKFNLI